jgi:putrescine transport system substrate-binding protein
MAMLDGPFAGGLLDARARTSGPGEEAMMPLVCRFTLIAALCALIASCSGGAAATPILNVYNWSDYIGDGTIAEFEKATGIKVHYSTFDANETLHAKMLAGHSGYDVVVPSSHWAGLQIQAGLFRKLDKTQIPNYANLDPAVLASLAAVDPGNQYLAPWLWGITTVGINVDEVKKALGDLPMPKNAWDLIFQPKYANRLRSCGLSLLDSGDEVFPAALKYLGKSPYSRDASDYEAAARLLMAIRPDVTLFSSSEYINDLAAGSICVVMGWNGDIGIAARRAREANNGQHIEIEVPSSGAVLFFDTMAIPRDARHVGEAYQWINFIYRPQVQAEIVDKVSYANPVRAADALIDPTVRGDPAVFLAGDDLKRMSPPGLINNDIRRLRTRLFTTFKTGA